MSKANLKSKAINIKGKDYVLVSDRVIYFNENYPKGSITTELVSEPSSDYIIMKAIVKPDDSYRVFTGYSQAVIGDGMVNKTAALENAETSAVGRALGMMGIGVIESIASADEMTKAATNSQPKRYATEKQVEWIRREASKVSGYDHADEIDDWVEEQLTLRPEKIPVFKVSDAVDKIKQIGEQSQKSFDKKYDKIEKEIASFKGEIVDIEELPY